MAILQAQKSDKDLKQEDVLQAVITADNFNDKFAPLTEEQPWVLLPVVNRPLIDYTLEYLNDAGIQEVFIFCCSHTEKIREYIKNSKWSRTHSTMTATVISSETYLSIGDMIRDLDCKGLIRSDFVLLDGGVVSTIPLRPIFEEHRKTVAKDKGALMTLIYRKAAPDHKTRCKDDECTVAICPESRKVLHHQRMSRAKKCDFPLEIFQQNAKVTVHHDLLNTHIAICSPHVPPVFSDNFDYQTREDFVKGILEHEEIMGNSIYVHVSDSNYAASISNVIMYDSVSKDMIQRWTYPLVPDQVIGDEELYVYNRHNVYRPASGLQLSRSCTLKQNVVIGYGTKIGDGTVVKNSVIGRNCSIGSNVKLSDVYMWDNVTVSDDCDLSMCLLSNGVVVKQGVTVQRGCILGIGVIVGPSVTLKERTLLQSSPMQNDFEEAGDAAEECDKALFGDESIAYKYVADAGTDDEAEDQVYDIWGKEDSSSEEEDSQQEGSDDEVEADCGFPPPDDIKLFYNEVVESLQRGMEEKVKCDNLILEINSSRYAYNITMKGVITVVSRVVVELPLLAAKEVSSADYLQQLKKCVQHFIPLLKNYVKGLEAQRDCLSGFEECMLHNLQHMSSLKNVLQWLYSKDILSEDAIVEWYNSHDAAASTEQGTVRKAVAEFVEWLQDAEEESD
ncbi:translation initiation factor eIF2B subunit epsilon-like [Ornithodoros turicata]|uniref:translation initiation factor eIF2B subunit epsilon-like n=1 Tax=Ornithodoros turicata TaxID=34597 RepID=UPI0031390AD5